MKKLVRCAALPILLVIPLLSCDILRLSVFEVSQWGPGEGRYADPSIISVYLRFSHKPDKTSIERYFSLLEGGNKVRGLFQWEGITEGTTEGTTMKFIPLSPLEKNGDYTLVLQADAHDTRGLSLDRKFEGRFSTRPHDTRTRLLDIFPEMNAVVEDSRTQIRLRFSSEILPGSLNDNVSFSPAMNGVWDYENSVGVFTPIEPWNQGKRYEIHISSSLQAGNGMTLGRDHSSIFSVGTDTQKPYLTGLWRIGDSGQEEELKEEVFNVFYENAGWEKSDQFRLVFSEPVDTLSVKNSIDLNGVSSLMVKTAPGFAQEIIFGLEKAPVFDSRFSLTIKSGVKDRYGNESEDRHSFRILANGAYSMPPVLIGIRLPLSPGNAVDRELASYGVDTLFGDLPVMDGSGRYPYNQETETWIECYFDTAPDTPIDNFSLMELFSVNTSNNVLSFSPRRVSASVFSTPLPRQGWEMYQRIEVQGKLVNRANSGIVYIDIAAGLRDSGGNRNEKPMRISLLN